MKRSFFLSFFFYQTTAEFYCLKLELTRLSLTFLQLPPSPFEVVTSLDVLFGHLLTCHKDSVYGLDCFQLNVFTNIS